jgi:hypothetical protein
MKKLIIIVLVLVLSIPAFSQKQKAFDNEFYFRFGYSLPSWNQYGYEKSDWEDGWKRVGWMGEVGTIFMLNGVFKSETVAFGIDVDYLSVYWSKFEKEFDNETIELWRTSAVTKVGPSITYSPVKRLAFDVYGKIGFDWFTGSILFFNEGTEDDEVFADVFSIGYSAGINIRYSLLMIGFEFYTSNPNLENVDSGGEPLENFLETGTGNNPLPCFNFTIGMSF